MLKLISPKITVGVHCAKLRTKGMYMNAVVDPDELTVLRSIRQHRLLVRVDPDRLRTRRRAGSGGSVQSRAWLLQVLNPQLRCTDCGRYNVSEEIATGSKAACNPGSSTAVDRSRGVLASLQFEFAEQHPVYIAPSAPKLLH